MPHVSAKQIKSEDRARLEKRLFNAFANTNTLSRKQIYEELLTPTERVMLAKRLEILLLIKKGVSTFNISKRLNVSPSTVARFEVAVENGKFPNVQQWLSHGDFPAEILRMVYEIAAVPFRVSKKRIRK